MNDFYQGLSMGTAQQIEPLSYLIYQLRENRKQLLQRYGVEHEDDLLELIRSTAVPEHPAYEHYLGAMALTETRELVRAQLEALLAGLGG
jgi:hypothetical protein